MMKPRPIEFMVRGYSVAEMLEVLARWDELSDADKVDLGFTELGDSGAEQRNKRATH